MAVTSPVPWAISGRTRLCGILGHPLDHTLSPRMHNAAFAALDLDWVYVPWPFPSEGMGDVLRGLRALANFAGANVTVPYKQAVLAHLEAVTAEARLVGAVNTIVREGDRLVGHTTDGAGLLAALAETTAFRPQGTQAVIVGAGGAGRAAAFALAAGGARRVTILNRSADRAHALAQEVRRAAPEVEVVAYALHGNPTDQILGTADLIVNATTVGMYPSDSPPIDLTPCGPHAVTYDMVYRPPETSFLRSARSRGLRAANGLSMLLHQGAAAFALWTGRAAPLEVMRRALESAETP